LAAGPRPSAARPRSSGLAMRVAPLGGSPGKPRAASAREAGRHQSKSITAQVMHTTRSNDDERCSFKQNVHYDITFHLRLCVLQ
jgi:hypothetical protein